MGLAGILVALGLLVWLSYRGWSILLLAPAAALIAAAAAGEPLLAHWTQTFMGGGAQFLAQFFPLFLLGALFGKLMEDSGSVEVIARFMTEKLGTGRAVLAVVLAAAIVTYGGVSLFVAIFVIVPMAQGLFRTADIPLRLMPAAIALGTMTFTMSALPGTPALQNAIPMPFFGTTPFAAPGLGIIAGPAMSSILAAWGLNVPFFAAAALSLVTAIAGFVFLPESLQRDRRAGVEQRIPVLSALGTPLGLFLFLTLFVSFAMACMETTSVYFVSDRFGMSEVPSSMPFLGAYGNRP
jgi:hypothetical protein